MVSILDLVVCALEALSIEGGRSDFAIIQSPNADGRVAAAVGQRSDQREAGAGDALLPPFGYNQGELCFGMLELCPSD